MKPLAYLMKQFGTGFSKDWSTLTDADKETLKAWAADEMNALGIAIA